MAHAQESLITDDIEAYLRAHEHKSLLRFITCGSVDDGKSTLIGRLLYESHLVFEDHLAALEADSKKVGTQGGDLDFALLVDGLAAEREQGITIDVAYRFFCTERRKFIVADTPGHEQYTRNMVTGASNAELAVILIDARKRRAHADAPAQLPRRRCSASGRSWWRSTSSISSTTTKRSSAASRPTTARSRPRSVSPTSPASRCRRSVVTTSPSRRPNTPWYDGPTLIGHLEDVDVEDRAADGPFRMPVQWVNRPNLDFRGFSGLVSSGTIRPGDAVRALPSGRTSTVARISTFDGDLDEAIAGQSVTLVLADEIDVSRGDVLCARRRTGRDRRPVRGARGVDARRTPGARPPVPRQGRRPHGRVSPSRRPKYKVNVNTLEQLAAKTLELNEIGVCTITTDRPIPFDPYAANRDTGGLVIIDRITQRHASARACSHFALRRSQNVHWQAIDVTPAARSELKGHGPAVVWFTGLSGRGEVDDRRTGPSSCSTPSACTPRSSTATTCATASTTTSASPRPTASRTSVASPRSRS